MQHLGCVLDFERQMIKWDGIELPMNTISAIQDPRDVMSIYCESLKPEVTQDATNRAVKILDANYKKAYLTEVIWKNCSHLSNADQKSLLDLLSKYEVLFDGTLGDWDTPPVKFELKPDAKPWHGKAYPVPQVPLAVFKKEIKRLCRIGVLKRQTDSEWGAPSRIIPKKDLTVRFISDFWQVNK